MAGLDYVKIYREWPDDKLKNEYEKKYDYEEVAIEAMETVLKERGLLDEVEDTLENANLDSFTEELEDTTSLESLAANAAIQDQERIERREKAMAKKIQDEADSAGDGVYLEGSLHHASRVIGTSFLFTFAFVGWILIFVAKAVKDMPDSVYNWTLAITVILTILGFWNLSIGRGSIKVYKTGKDEVTVEMKQGKHSFTFSSPLKMNCYAVKTEQSVNGIKANSYFTLYMQFEMVDGTKVSLTRSNGTGGLPSGWEWVGFQDPIYQSDYAFNYTNNKKLKLNSLRILLEPHRANA